MKFTQTTVKAAKVPPSKSEAIYFDDELIRKDGLFVTPELLALNPENLKYRNKETAVFHKHSLLKQVSVPGRPCRLHGG